MAGSAHCGSVNGRLLPGLGQSAAALGHIIAAIAWIGASFYFVMLDNSLEKPATRVAGQGVGGEQWAVHGGGFYNMQKYAVQPKRLPEHLHWSFWEATAPG